MVVWVVASDQLGELLGDYLKSPLQVVDQTASLLRDELVALVGKDEARYVDEQLFVQFSDPFGRGIVFSKYPQRLDAVRENLSPFHVVQEALLLPEQLNERA